MIIPNQHIPLMPPNRWWLCTVPLPNIGSPNDRQGNRRWAGVWLYLTLHTLAHRLALCDNSEGKTTTFTSILTGASWYIWILNVRKEQCGRSWYLTVCADYVKSFICWSLFCSAQSQFVFCSTTYNEHGGLHHEKVFLMYMHSKYVENAQCLSSVSCKVLSW